MVAPWFVVIVDDTFADPQPMPMRLQLSPRASAWSCCGRRGARRAVAAVEAAIALPLLILLVFGAIEVANGIFLTQTLTVAAYEGAREAARPGGTAEQVEERIADVLARRGLAVYSVAIEPAISDSTPRGTAITVEVQAAMNSFAGYSIGILGNRTSSRSACMVRH